MNYIIITTDKYNFHKLGKSTFNSMPILSGEHKGKFATSENALKEFPEIFENEEYEIAELIQSDFQPDYSDKIDIDGAKLIQVLDLYNGTINIYIWYEEQEVILNRPYENTWGDNDVIKYVKGFIN